VGCDVLLIHRHSGTAAIVTLITEMQCSVSAPVTSLLRSAAKETGVLQIRLFYRPILCRRCVTTTSLKSRGVRSLQYSSAMHAYSETRTTCGFI